MAAPSLLRAMATLPGVLLVPGDGSQQLRPIAAEDLACVVVAALASPQWRGKVIEVVGPEILTLRDYLLAWRAWFGLPTPRVVATPKPLVNVTVALGEAMRPWTTVPGDRESAGAPSHRRRASA